MNANPDASTTSVCWFVGASFGAVEDQTERFLQQGIWENGYEDRYLELVKSMRRGEHIVIKAAYTRRHDLPFDNRGQSVSVMAIKAIGIVSENAVDGRSVKVQWTGVEPVREWYFFTSRVTVWRVLPEDWKRAGLIDFALNGKPQDLDRFRNSPFWRERYGDNEPIDRFEWTRFYEQFADRLLEYKERRQDLIQVIDQLNNETEGLAYLYERDGEGEPTLPVDICPFTLMGTFNRQSGPEKRSHLAAALGKCIGVSEAAPTSFDGIPVLNPIASWFYGRDGERDPDHIQGLWELFEAGINLADVDIPENMEAFCRAFDNMCGRAKVGWKLTFGLYWIRPWHFPPLDRQTRFYFSEKLRVRVGMNGPDGRSNAEDYLAIIEKLESRFEEEAYPIHSFPELSLAAWDYKDRPAEPRPIGGEPKGKATGGDEEPIPPTSITPYSVGDIISDGCFVERANLDRYLELLRVKKNLILQGPPGTGKTWLARKLAFALIGERDETRVRVVQFHPNLAYEDFVRGWRPSGEGKLDLVDGPFLQMINLALEDSSSRYVIVIEEINRGNPAQIFGEMLTLLEADKRTPEEAIELCFNANDTSRVFIPANLFVIGTMNIADRSIALVDLALRRRFAFANLEPTFGPAWRNWVSKRCKIDINSLTTIESRLLALNAEIAGDPGLGRQFRIGHSYVTPPFDTIISDPWEWFRQVVLTEIGPQLDEYWFDSLQKADDARKRLLEGLG